MKHSIRWSVALLLTTALLPAVSFARPVRAISRPNTTAVRQRTPNLQIHEAVLRHAR